MNALALVAFALWALFMRYLPSIIQFLRLKRFAATIPGPSIGELIARSKKGQILEWLHSLRKKHGPVFRIWLGRDLMVFFSDPEDVKQLLSNNTLLKKSRSYELAEAWLGKGLLTSSDDAWHRRRKLLTPAFHFRILSEFKEPIEENCKIFIRKLREKANGEQFDIYPYITLFALDAILETAMGIKKNAQMQSESEYVKAVQTICRVMHKQSFSFWQRFEIIFRFTNSYKERTEALKILHGETKRVIKLRRQMLQDTNIQTMADAEKSDDVGGKRRLAFLDMLLISQQEGGGLTDQEIREEVDTFLFEGHDTTSSAIAFCIYLLSQHREIQQRAYEEASALRGHEKESMRYMEAVIKETLRLYPSVPFYSRKVQEDLQLGNITVPKGASVSTLAYMVHRDEKYYPEPEKFDPERFLAAEKDLHPFAFVAFSAGPRNCIGQKFAMLELKLSLSSLLRSYEFLPAEGFKPKALAELVMKSGNGVQIRLRPRI
ncbi:probable cytochrome P450 4s3 isoform X1 [Rhagoletis pomonella]|uniref:probable cytochrome P450 4s3 isoform X1 n=2 Tax=Rhagoletis pomonella TaxID=28610 RepID=UPI0017802E29|nr:probable cytochrome P450 4s3 isoform X1 [Rhagoletis pomonella]